MKKLQKGFVAPFLVVIIAVLVVGGGAYFYTQNKAEINTSLNATTTNNLQTDNNNLDWKIYNNTNLGIEFRYPSKILVSESSQEVRLNHSIPYKHNDACDMRDGATKLNTFTDFGVNMKLYNQSLENAVKSESPYLVNDYLINGKLKVEPGYIDSYKIGSLNGYSIYQGVEGCGYTTYYFPISDSKTLMVKRGQVTEFSGALTDATKAEFLAISGVIPPEEADELFKQILLSLKVKN